MDQHQARTAVDWTLYATESVLAMGRGVNVNLKGPIDPISWIAFTQSRLVQVNNTTGQPLSTPLPEVRVLELRRSLMGGYTLRINSTTAPGSIGLTVDKIDKAFAEAVRPLISARDGAPRLPDETTSYLVAKQVLEGPMATLMGTEFVEFRCSRCGGLCGGGSISGGALSAAPEVFERCNGCLRRVIEQVELSP